MTSAIIARIWKLLLPSSWRATSQTGAESSTSYTASHSYLLKPEDCLNEHVNLEGSCTKSNEDLSRPDAVYNLEQHNSVQESLVQQHSVQQSLIQRSPIQHSSVHHGTLRVSPRTLFKHKPLNHYQPTMRLVTVSPDLSTEGYIQCSIHHTTTNAHYSCLSYTWGEPEPKQLLLINGRKFHVRKNLFDFLETIRGHSRSRRTKYWIDALCIDQSNKAERNHQVGQMGMIYSKATRVVAWLGRMLDEPLLHEKILGLTGISHRHTRNHVPKTNRSK
jgi:hypothetical protein